MFNTENDNTSSEGVSSSSSSVCVAATAVRRTSVKPFSAVKKKGIFFIIKCNRECVVKKMFKIYIYTTLKKKRLVLGVLK